MSWGSFDMKKMRGEGSGWISFPRSFLTLSQACWGSAEDCCISSIWKLCTAIYDFPFLISYRTPLFKMNKLTSRDLLLSVVAMSDPLFFNKSLSKFPLTFPPPNKPYSTQRPSRARLLMFCSQKELPTQSKITSAPFPEEITKIPKNLNTSSILPECKGLAPL